jgi:hypothetical protein
MHLILEDNNESTDSKVSDLESYKGEDNTNDYLLLADVSKQMSFKITLKTLREYLKNEH